MEALAPGKQPPGVLAMPHRAAGARPLRPIPEHGVRAFWIATSRARSSC